MLYMTFQYGWKTGYDPADINRFWNHTGKTTMIILSIGSESTKSKIIVNNFKIVARFPDCDRRTDKPCNSVAALFYKKKLGFSEKQKPIGQAVKGIFCIRHNSFYTVSIFLSTFPYFIRHMQRTYDTFRRGKLRRGGERI